jgi:hypothetical protein
MWSSAVCVLHSHGVPVCGTCVQKIKQVLSHLHVHECLVFFRIVQSYSDHVWLPNACVYERIVCPLQLCPAQSALKTDLTGLPV